MLSIRVCKNKLKLREVYEQLKVSPTVAGMSPGLRLLGQVWGCYRWGHLPSHHHHARPELWPLLSLSRGSPLGLGSALRGRVIKMGNLPSDLSPSTSTPLQNLPAFPLSPTSSCLKYIMSRLQLSSGEFLDTLLLRNHVLNKKILNQINGF